MTPATSTRAGLVKGFDNLTIQSGGVLSLTEDNVVSAFWPLLSEYLTHDSLVDQNLNFLTDINGTILTVDP